VLKIVDQNDELSIIRSGFWLQFMKSLTLKVLD